MTRLPSRPSGNKPPENNNNLTPPVLGSGREVFLDSTKSPQLASSEPVAGISAAANKAAPLPVAAPTPPEISPFKPEAPVVAVRPSKGLPSQPSTPAAVSAKTAPEPQPEAPVAVEKTVQVQPTAPSIENLSFTKEEAYQNALDLQKRREVAINMLPAHLKRSINKLFEHLTDDTSSEVTINGPKSIGFKRAGQRFIDNEIDFIDTETYHAIINDFLLPLTNTHERIGTTPYLIEGQLNIPDPENSSRLPMIARMHILTPPAVEVAQITIAKKARNQLTIDSMVQNGTMTTDMGKFLKDVAKGRATIVFSGLSGSGKTTVLEAMSREFDISDRIVLVEDTEELSLNSSSVVSLLSHQSRPGENAENSVTLEWLVRQANRMRPERIIVGEVRGAEMAEFLTAANSGADGSMTTVHANSPQQAINKMISLSMKSASVKSEASLLRDIASTVQVIVQMSIIDGKHIVSQIEEVSNTVNRSTMGIQTATIYKYNRNDGRFNFETRVSDEFQMFLKQRGVEVSNPNSLITRRY